MILRESYIGFRGMDVEDIVRTIDNNPDGDELVSLDKELLGDEGIKSVTDLRFIINVPDGTEMLVDVEIQSQSNTGIKKLKQRMFRTVGNTAEMNEDLKENKGLDLGEAILTIWIVMTPEKTKHNMIERFAHLNIDTHEPLLEERVPDLVVFNLSEDWENVEGALKALDLLFLADESEERTMQLNKLNINPQIADIGGASMYSFSESLIETGIDMGIERSMVKYMNAGHTFDEAFDLFQEPGMDREEVRSRIESS